MRKKRAKLLLFFETTKYFFIFFEKFAYVNYFVYFCAAKVTEKPKVKRALYIIGVLLVSLLLVGGTLVATLMSDRVETAAVQLVTRELARTFGTNAHIGNVSYHFPARVLLKDVYIEDKQGDTLAYISEAYAHFKPLALQENEIRFSHLHLKNGVAKIYQTDQGEWNYQFLVDAFAKKEKKESLQSLLAVEDIRLDSMRVHYEDWQTEIDHAKMDLHELSEEVLDAEIRELKGRLSNEERARGEQLDVESMKAHLIFNDTMLAVPTLTAELPNSRCDLSGIEIHYPTGDTLYLSKSAHEIDFKVTLHEACLIPSDLALLAPKLANLKREICMTGMLSGRLDSLRAKDLAVSYNHQQIFVGDLYARGLPKMEDLYLQANFQDIHTNAPMLQDFLSQLNNRPVHLPVYLHRLGEMHYRGLAEGRPYEFSLHGAFRSALGTITTDGEFACDTNYTNMRYNARVVARKFRFGRLLSVPDWTSATVDAKLKGEWTKGTDGEEDNLEGTIKGSVRDFIYKGYTYDELTLDGQYAPKLYKGQFAIDDEHLKLAFNGVVNLQEKVPAINCDLVCRHVDTEPLGINVLGSGIRSRFKMAVDLDGTNIDKMSGYLVLDSLFVGTVRDSILMRQMTLLVDAGTNKNKYFTLRSDYLTAEANGTFRYADLVPALQNMVHHYLPSAVPASSKRPGDVELNLHADGHRLRDLQRLYEAPLTLSDHPTLRAKMNLPADKEPKIDMRFYAPGVRAMNTPLHDLTIVASTVDTLRHTGSYSGSGLSLSLSTEAHQMHTVLSCLAFRDTLLTHVTLRQESDLDERLPDGWRELSPRQLQLALSDLDNRERMQALVAAQRAGTYGGDIRLTTHFDRYNNLPLIDMHIHRGSLLLRDSTYTIGESRVTYCAADTTIAVDHFSFDGGGQHLSANGIGSPRNSDSLTVALAKIDASYVVPFLLPVQTIMFNGLLTGKAQISSLMRKPQIDAQIHVDSMGLNNCYFGEADVDLHIHDSLFFHADVMRPTRKVVDLNGEAHFDGSGRWKLDMMADSVPLAFVNHWTNVVIDDLDGYGSGHVCVGGEKESVYVLLRAEAQDASLTLPWTGCRYTIAHDTIVMDTTSILFPNVHLTDAEGHPVEVNGGIYHKQFSQFQLDLHVDIHNALVFDLPDKQGEMLQGHVYANGHADVTGTDEDIHVNADAVTTGKSRFRLSIDNTASAYESNFIHFVTHKTDTQTSDGEEEVVETDLDNIDLEINTKDRDEDKYKRAGRCLLTLNIEINPRLLFQFVLGERTGDIIQGRGSGALRLTYDTETGDVRLLGTYDLEQGTLSYTVANVIRREFTVANGSTIVFSGDATNPQLDVTAQYRVTANLKDLFGDEIDQIGTTRSNIPVLTGLHMTGPLNNPILSFSLEFPLSDQTIQQQVRQVINTDEMLMRQVIYLLVFGRFFTPDYMNQAQYATLNSTYSLLSSTVTGQINNWLSKLTDMLTLGVAIRTDGEGANASQEYEAQFQLQPVDRLVINGNVGYRYNDISNQPFFGDLDVELLLTQDGQFRLKGYTHTVDKYSLRQATTMQGVSFLWKKDFNWPTAEQTKAKRAARKAKRAEKKK